MSNEAKIAGRQPIAVELEEGKKYAWCTCGEATEHPFCDGSHAGTSFKPHVFTAEKSGQAYLCMCKRTNGAPHCDGAHALLDSKD